MGDKQRLQTDVLINTKHLPLQDEWRVGLAIARVVDMNGVSTVCSELAKCSLASTHALCQAAASARHT